MSKQKPVRRMGKKGLATVLMMVALFCVWPLSARAAGEKETTQKKPVMKSVAMFGYAVSFKDSVVCLTEIQTIDSAWIEPAHNFLLDRSLYSLQLQMYMEQQGHKNAICTIFYDKNPRKLQRMWRKVYKRSQKQDGLRYQELPVSAFRLKAEEYRPIIMEESTQ